MAVVYIPDNVSYLVLYVLWITVMVRFILSIRAYTRMYLTHILIFTELPYLHSLSTV